MRYVTIGLMLWLLAACHSQRPAARQAPADDAEYYQADQTARQAQHRLYPDPQGGLGHAEDPDIRVTDIRLTATYTVVYMTFAKDRQNPQSDFYGTSSISFNPKAVLATPDGKKTYALLKVQGIPMSPESQEIKNDQQVPFVLYFEKLDKGIETVDLFECQSDNQNSCFNVVGLPVRNPL